MVEKMQETLTDEKRQDILDAVEQMLVRLTTDRLRSRVAEDFELGDENLRVVISVKPLRHDDWSQRTRTEY